MFCIFSKLAFSSWTENVTVSFSVGFLSLSLHISPWLLNPLLTGLALCLPHTAAGGHHCCSFLLGYHSWPHWFCCSCSSPLTWLLSRPQLLGILQSSAKRSAKSSPWGGTAPCTSACWGPPSWLSTCTGCPGRQEGCGVSVLGDIQKPTGYGCRQPMAMLEQDGGPDNFQRSFLGF